MSEIFQCNITESSQSDSNEQDILQCLKVESSAIRDSKTSCDPVILTSPNSNDSYLADTIAALGIQSTTVSEGQDEIVIPNPCTLFVGDLSIFCSENDLLGAFRSFDEEIVAKVMRCEETYKNLCYGFVKFTSQENAAKAMEDLNSKLLCGRPMRISWAGHRTKLRSQNGSSFSSSNTNSLPNSCSSSFSLNSQKMVSSSIHIYYQASQAREVITEETLRKVFDKFGDILDITVKRFSIDEESNSQRGYGFVHFPSDEAGISSAKKCAEVLKGVCIDEITFTCELSHKLMQQLNIPCPVKAVEYISKPRITNKSNRYGRHGRKGAAIIGPILSPSTMDQSNVMMASSEYDGYNYYPSQYGMMPPPPHSYYMNVVHPSHTPLTQYPQQYAHMTNMVEATDPLYMFDNINGGYVYRSDSPSSITKSILLTRGSIDDNMVYMNSENKKEISTHYQQETNRNSNKELFVSNCNVGGPFFATSSHLPRASESDWLPYDMNGHFSQPMNGNLVQLPFPYSFGTLPSFQSAANGNNNNLGAFPLIPPPPPPPLFVNAHQMICNNSAMQSGYYNNSHPAFASVPPPPQLIIFNPQQGTPQRNCPSNGFGGSSGREESSCLSPAHTKSLKGKWTSVPSQRVLPRSH